MLLHIKNKKTLILIFAFAFNYSSPNKFIIGSAGCGFFTDFLGVINNIMWCEENNKIPVVYWNEKSKYYVPEGYNNQINAWEYYFESLSAEIYQKNDSIYTDYWTGSKSDITSHHKDLVTRKKINDIVNRYIKIKSNIQHKIDSFYKNTMNKKRTIGIHLRGTDKAIDMKLINTAKIIGAANRYADQNTHFFIASEDQILFEYAKKELKGEVIYRDIFRISTNQLTENNIGQYEWWQYLENKAFIGEEALIDAKILSLCDKLICTSGSALSTAALFFNPELAYEVIG